MYIVLYVYCVVHVLLDVSIVIYVYCVIGVWLYVCIV